ERAKRPTLVITPTIDLMNQWYDELVLSFGTEVGLLGGGYYDIRPLTVTTYDSAYLNMDRLGNKFGLIVFDECHHLPGPTYGLAAARRTAPVPPGAARHARARRHGAHPPRRADRPDRLPPRDHPAPRALPGGLPRDDAVRPPQRRGAHTLRA